MHKSRHSPIFPGRYHPSIFGVCELNCCVRNGNRWDLTAICTGNALLEAGNMEAGGRKSVRLYTSMSVANFKVLSNPENRIKRKEEAKSRSNKNTLIHEQSTEANSCLLPLKTHKLTVNHKLPLATKRSSPRPISTRRLNASPRLHRRPINLIVYEGSYS